MEKIVEGVPASLREDLSKKLVAITLGTRERDAIPTELAKKIIYIWRQDQLASVTGVHALMDAALLVDTEATYRLLDELGLKELTIALKGLK